MREFLVAGNNAVYTSLIGKAGNNILVIFPNSPHQTCTTVIPQKA